MQSKRMLDAAMACTLTFVDYMVVKVRRLRGALQMYA
jgi:hypothetical protein